VSGTGFTVSGVTFPITLTGNQTATLTVQFDPTTAGAATGQLTLTSNSASGTSTLISLTVRGAIGLISARPWVWFDGEAGAESGGRESST
jgi:hypothetical protein